MSCRECEPFIVFGSAPQRKSYERWEIVGLSI